MDELLDGAPCGFLSFGADGIVTLCNATLGALLERDPAEVVGGHVERILSIGSRIFYQTHWFPLLQLHGAAEEIFLLLRSKSGQDVGTLVNAVRHQRGGTAAFDCVVMRVRERQKYEDELLRARRTAEQALRELEEHQQELQRANDLLEQQAVDLETASEELRVMNEQLLERSQDAERHRAAADEASRAKSNFLAVMSHELRTPLNAIGGYVQLMEMGIHGPVSEAQREALGRVARSQAHLLRLINDLLDLSRIEAGRVEYAIEDLPVGELVEAVVPMVEPQFARKGIAFEVEVAGGLVVRGDRDKVQQVLINLLGNAVKFTPQGGRVRLVAEQGVTGRGVVAVEDNGMGIPAEKLESVFHPFVRVEGAGRQAEGSGLGLAISREMARGMGGDLVATSEPGKGSRFELSLPPPPAGRPGEEKEKDAEG